jgi:hypothetical protein
MFETEREREKECERDSSITFQYFIALQREKGFNAFIERK